MSIDSVEYIDSRIRVESLDTDIWFDITRTRRQLIMLRKKLEMIVEYLSPNSFSFGNFPDYKKHNVPDSMKMNIQWLRRNPLFMMDYYYEKQLDEIYDSIEENPSVVSQSVLIDIHHKYVNIHEYVGKVVEYYSWSLKYIQKK